MQKSANPSNFILDPVFAALLPAHDSATRDVLTTAIETDGRARDPITVATIRGHLDGNPILIDGYQRVSIISELRARGQVIQDPQVDARSFGSMADAVRWVLTNEKARRFWGPEHRAWAVLNNEESILRREEARARMKSGRRDPEARAPRGQRRVDEQLAFEADVSPTTIKRVRKIKESGDQELIRRVLADDRDNQKISVAEAAKQARAAGTAREIAQRAVTARAAWGPHLLVRDDGHSFENVVVCGDCENVLKRVPDGAATMILCSPPYPIPHERLSFDAYRFPGYDQWLADFAARSREFYRVLRHGGRFVLNLDLTSDRTAGHAAKYPALLDAANAARDAGFELLDGFTWFKQKASGSGPGWGTYCSPALPSIRRVDEPVLLFYKGCPRLEGDDALADTFPDDFERATISTWNYHAGQKRAAETVLDSFWYIPTAQRQPGGCPVPFPEKLVELVLRNWTRRNDLVIDPYNGSGTTVAVAQRLGRRFLGIDLSADYCAQARARLNGSLGGGGAQAEPLDTALATR